MLKHTIGVKILKERKEKKVEEKNKKGVLHRTAKPIVESEIYNNNKKCD